MTVARKLVLTKHMKGEPSPDGFRIDEEKLAEPAAGQVLVAVDRLSVDAWITTTLGGGKFHGTIPIGGMVPAFGVGRVVSSGADGFRQGDAVLGMMGAQSHLLVDGAGLQRLDDSAIDPAAYLGALGMTTGLTAHVGMVEIGQVQPGDTVVVSAAAGQVGSFAVEIARLRGARVIGIAGGAAKCRYVTEKLGAVGAIDYKNDDVGARLSELAPGGINLFFDNVGGEVLDLVLDRMATGARIVICGAISQYGHLDQVRGPSLYLRLAERNSSMRGFTVNAHAHAHPAAFAELRGWLLNGDFHVAEHVEQGIDKFPAALAALYTGAHIGKVMVQP